MIKKNIPMNWDVWTRFKMNECIDIKFKMDTFIIDININFIVDQMNISSKSMKINYIISQENEDYCFCSIFNVISNGYFTGKS